MKLSELVEQSGPLKYVESYSFPELESELCCLKLKFEKNNCFIKVNKDTNEIVFTETNPTDNLIKTQNHSFWAQFTDREVSWVWALVNNQGYHDGIKLEFTGVDAAVELIVIASSLKIYRIEKIA